MREKVVDVNRDGLDDLLLRFKLGDAKFMGGETDATLTGRTYPGDQFSDSDSIRTVNGK
ncbi:MAG: hypothetical protein U9R74_19705 [Pseudomonadota bacterium]|nr:hypothetical protein [Pseudomonadota bacterium]